eukprot:INCI14067.3.p1 GENE.INCI14067.3~~INCI14067.3.p1  ORF type:complete len:475 (-),score=63.43 INCI14067.3:436-1860(-)
MSSVAKGRSSTATGKVELGDEVVTSAAHIAHVVDAKNFDAWLPEIWKALDNCSFLAIDTEFTGLSASRDMGNQDLRIRYTTMRHHVNNYALLQIGLSFFKCTTPTVETPASAGSTNQNQIEKPSVQDQSPNDSGVKKPKPKRRKKPPQSYDTVTYTLNVTQQEDFIVSASSLQFLAKSGAQLDDIFRDGIPFHFCFEQNQQMCHHCRRLEEEKAEAADTDLPPTSRQRRRRGTNCRNTEFSDLFTRIRDSKKVVVLHNGLLDLLFLHASFYRPLPTSFSTFVNSVAAWLPRVVDTKYISLFETREENSFLQSLFKKYSQNKQIRVACEKQTLPEPETAVGEVSELKTSAAPDAPICSFFQNGGRCRRGSKCPFTHAKTGEGSNDESASAPTPKPTKRTAAGSGARSDADNPVRKRCRSSSKECTQANISSESCQLSLKNRSTQCIKVAVDVTKLSATRAHTAGFDAFATGSYLV